MKGYSLMPTITKISTQKRPGYYNIFLDESYAFSVTEQVLIQFELAKDKVLTKEQVETIQSAQVYSKAEQAALNFLSYKMRSITEIKQYLAKKEYAEEVSQQVVTRLQEMGYLDDAAYAKAFIVDSLRLKKDGPYQIMQKLKQKGVNSEISEQQLAEVRFEDWEEVALRTISSLVKQTAKYSKRQLETKIRQKLMARGFSGDLMTQLMQSVEVESSEDDQLIALTTQGIKAYKKFRRYPEFERNQKIKRFLVTKGFSFTEIDQFLAGEVIDLEELAQY
ncbi:recombination regulator RecX [Holzapfeliella sp. He02]|uniref:Regulatory protein RecX n=1 Tax=Holzapfeliella saturejae TaxID=3082953 RepID=A0ABU8SJ70_9LACO